MEAMEEEVTAAEVTVVQGRVLKPVPVPAPVVTDTRDTGEFHSINSNISNM